LTKRIPRVWFIILAGGKRALNPKDAAWLPKMLEKIGNLTVLDYVIRAAKGVTSAKVSGITVVISSLFEEVLRDALRTKLGISIAVQEKHHGTLDAVWSAFQQGVFPQKEEAEQVVILMGDQPLITSDDIDELIVNFNKVHPMRAGVMTFRQNRRIPEFAKCGVIIRKKGIFSDLKARIPIPRGTKTEELHAGPYIFSADWLRGSISILGQYQSNFPESMPEVQLYDALIASRYDTGVHLCRCTNPDDYLGVDTQIGLRLARERMARRLREKKKKVNTK